MNAFDQRGRFRYEYQRATESGPFDWVCFYVNGEAERLIHLPDPCRDWAVNGLHHELRVTPDMTDEQFRGLLRGLGDLFGDQTHPAAR